MATGNLSFRDIFKSRFLENTASISVLDMALGMLLAFLLGIFIFWIYKKTYRGVMYSASFGATLIGLTMISTLVILAVTSNIVLSLGMVGALSIVRFRTAIKDPLDIAFLFWSIAAGIVLASGLLPLAVFGSLFIGIVLYFFATWKVQDAPYILVLRCDTPEAEELVRASLETQVRRLVLKSKSVSSGIVEVNYEVRLKEEDAGFLRALSETEGVRDVILVGYNGEYVG